MHDVLPAWLDPGPWLGESGRIDDVRDGAEVGRLLRLLGPKDPAALEEMARRALSLTRRHFGRTISLYAPLYLSNHCSGGCVYCGFASDRRQPRLKLEGPALMKEIDALKASGIEDVLLLTGERTEEAGFDYLLECVSLAAKRFHRVSIEAFAMDTDEYRRLGEAGCTGITLYQETYDPRLYDELHRWGPKRDYTYRLEAPARALAAGLRTVGIGALLGLGDPVLDAVCLFRHILHLRRRFWRAGVLVSFPRVCPQEGDYRGAHEVSDRALAQMVFAFRICLPDVPLVLSTREGAEFRDGLAGLGISRMSVASRTTVGGYGEVPASDKGQFDVNDSRGVGAFCAALKGKGLEPVFKNWDSTLSLGSGTIPATS